MNTHRKIKLTSAQKRDLLLISKNNVCRYSSGMRGSSESHYQATDGYAFIYESMVNKLIDKGLVEKAELYRERNPKYKSWPGQGWGHFLRLTDKGKKALE